jgi:hypothetical protein
MPSIKNLDFADNHIIRGREEKYQTINIKVDSVLDSWRMSLFSYEWILPDGRIRDLTELSDNERAKRASVEKDLQQGTKLEKPILGIGLLENIEIGSGRAVFLTLAAHGCKTMPVHIPKSSIKEFAPFQA